MFCCIHCQRNYQRKLYFERHVITCQFLSKTKKERTLESEELADTPSIRELYNIIMTLAAKCNNLETKLTAMNKWTCITKQKININDWLNITYPHILLNYDEWINQICIISTDLTFLFEADYVSGVVNVLKQQLQLLPDEVRPMRAFNGKDNTLYIYRCSTQKWELCEQETFTKLMYFLDQQFMREFIVWQTQNKSRMAVDDSFSDLYAKNMKKIMGGAYSREQLYLRIKKELYQYLRRDPPNIIEYEPQF